MAVVVLEVIGHPLALLEVVQQQNLFCLYSQPRVILSQLVLEVQVDLVPRMLLLMAVILFLQPSHQQVAVTVDLDRRWQDLVVVQVVAALLIVPAVLVLPGRDLLEVQAAAAHHLSQQVVAVAQAPREGMVWPG
jgi:hypothetical protein